MAYHEAMYFTLFLPMVLIFYQLVPQKFRWSVLLFFSYVFYIIMSRKLVIVLICATVLTYSVGLVLEWMKRKAKERCAADEISRE